MKIDNKQNEQDDDFKNVISNKGKLEINFVDPFQSLKKNSMDVFKDLSKSKGNKRWEF